MSRMGEWLKLAWPPSLQNANIAAKELLPIILSFGLWGSHWTSEKILFRKDSQVVVAALTSISARDHTMSHLLWCLFFFEAYFDVEHKVFHLPEWDNPTADANSCNNVDQFFSLCPQATPMSKAIPPAAHGHIAYITSPHWSDLLNSTLQGYWHRQQEMHMRQPRGDT